MFNFCSPNSKHESDLKWCVRIVSKDLVNVAAIHGDNLLQAESEGTAGPPRHRFAKGAPFLLNDFALGSLLIWVSCGGGLGLQVAPDFILHRVQVHRIRQPNRLWSVHGHGHVELQERHGNVRVMASCPKHNYHQGAEQGGAKVTHTDEAAPGRARQWPVCCPEQKKRDIFTNACDDFEDHYLC